ncbi:hypothetical protein, partial [Enterococcus faecium]|uniref:hypothetical protein n=1 Tax=Enterococcus faecium TaxID=1352 RepID=UPI003F43330F
MPALLDPPDTELSSLLSALTALRAGRTGVRLPHDWTGVAGKVADAFNAVVEQNERLTEELARLG